MHKRPPRGRLHLWHQNADVAPSVLATVSRERADAAGGSWPFYDVAGVRIFPHHARESRKAKNAGSPTKRITTPSLIVKPRALFAVNATTNRWGTGWASFGFHFRESWPMAAGIMEMNWAVGRHYKGPSRRQKADALAAGGNHGLALGEGRNHRCPRPQAMSAARLVIEEVRRRPAAKESCRTVCS